jgi:hypothetical protein
MRTGEIIVLDHFGHKGAPDIANIAEPSTFPMARSNRKKPRTQSIAHEDRLRKPAIPG